MTNDPHHPLLWPHIHQAIIDSVDRLTSSDPDGWTPENPMYGQCAVVALVIARRDPTAWINRGVWSDGSVPGSHYWVELPAGPVDVTFEQYPDDTPRPDVTEMRTVERLLSDPGTRRRYELLEQRVSRMIGPPPPNRHYFKTT